MCKNLKLYDHTEDIYDKWIEISKTEKDVLIILGCGLGKTGIAAKIIQNNFIDKPVLYVLPVYSIYNDIINKDFWDFPNVKFIMYRSLEKVNPDDYSLCIFDEGHHIGAPTWLKQFNKFQESSCYTITMTATDYRLDGLILRNDIFNTNNTIVGMSMFDAISLNKIRRPEYVSALLNPSESEEIVLSYAKKKYTSIVGMKQLSDSLNNMLKFDEILKKYASNKRRILAFVSRISEVDNYYDKIVDVYPDALIFKIHSKLSRSKIIEALRIFNSDIDKPVILISVNMLNEGIHPTGIDCLLMIRDTSSVIMYMQQIGRLVDLNNPDKHTMIIDFIETHRTSRYMRLQSLLESPDNHPSDSIVDGPSTIKEIKEKIFDIVDDYYVDILDVIQTNINDTIWTEEIISKLGTMSDSDVARIYGLKATVVQYKRNQLGIAPHRIVYDWTDEMISKLGTMPDQHVSNMYGMSIQTVQRKRVELGIPLYIDTLWSEDIVSKLGTMPDDEFAKVYGVGIVAVANRRRSLGIPPYRKQLDWTDEMISKLGTMSDNDFAKAYNILTSQAVSKRKSLGIPAYIPKINWTNEIISKLGTMRDVDLAKSYGLNPGAVSRKRVRMGIPQYHPHVWTDEMISKLGTMPDTEVGKLYGKNKEAVSKKRSLLNIKPYKPPITNIKTKVKSTDTIIQWTGEMISKLGTMSDNDFAKSYNLTYSVVRNRRNSLGIPPYHKTIKWTDEMISKLGTMPDTEVGKLYGIPESAVQYKRSILGIGAYHVLEKWTDDILSMLGTISDRDVARKTGIPTQTITGKRNRLGIPPYRKLCEWTDEMISKLGTMPDTEVGKLYGISNLVVMRKRKALGIPTYRSDKK